MAKQVAAKVKLQVRGGQANPSPPVGPSLGQHGVNIMEFCKAFNDKTKGEQGPVPVVINVYKDKSFEFITKMAPASYLVMQKANLKKGSQAPGQSVVGKIKIDDVREVAERKMKDMNAYDLESAVNMILGTVRSMGLEVVEQ